MIGTDIRSLTEHRAFDRAIVALIVVNSLAPGLETSSAMAALFGGWLAVFDRVVVGVFAKLLPRVWTKSSATLNFVALGAT